MSAEKHEKPTSENLIYDFYFDEGARLGQRTDWFLIFHAILLEAFFAAHYRPPQAVIGVLGCLTAYLWFMTGCRQRWLSRHLGACMGSEALMGKTVSHVFEEIFAVRRAGIPKWMQWAMPVPTFAVVIPAAFTIAWSALLLWIMRESLLYLVASSVGAVLILYIATNVVTRLRNGPDISDEFVAPLARTFDAELEKTNATRTDNGRNS
jgi:hypothetical protein